MANIPDLQERLRREIEEQKKSKARFVGSDGRGGKIVIRHTGIERVRLDARVDEGEVEGEYEGEEEDWY